MYLSFKRLALLFMAIFAVLMIGVAIFEVFWREPGERCEEGGGWYDIETRVCAMPLYIPDITGREPGESREAASRRGPAEVEELERRVAAQRAARQEAVRAEQEELRQAQ